MKGIAPRHIEICHKKGESGNWGNLMIGMANVNHATRILKTNRNLQP